MHNLFLGELRHHCMDVWGIDIKDKPSGQKVRAHTPEEQQTNIVKAMNALHKESETALDKLRKGYIVAFARLNDVPPVGTDLTKASYIKGLIDWVKTPGFDFDSIRAPKVLAYDAAEFHLSVDAPDISKYRVLSYDVLQAIRKDIPSTYLPSWLERPPANFGSPKHGKLKADQWRTVCTINMVITLVRLWSSANASEHDKKLLENFLHLVSAVDLASRRTMSEARAAAYDEHMYRYLVGLKELFDHQFVPNHHLSLHLYSCLLLFGPVHGWWAFPFERYNGLIASINTNYKSADMPVTFMRYFYIGANIRRLMGTMDWPDTEEFKEMLNSFEDAFGEVLRGSRIVDTFPFRKASGGTAEGAYEIKSEEGLPETIYEGILRLLNRLSTGQKYTSAYASRATTRNSPTLNPKGEEVPSIKQGNLVFATADKGLRDSFVVFRAEDTDGDGLRAGQISKIYLHSRTKDSKPLVEPFFLVNVYRPLTGPDAARDPYRRWPDIHTRLYYNEFEADARIIGLDNIVAHFAAHAYTPEDIASECMLVRNLDRVRRVLYFRHCLSAHECLDLNLCAPSELKAHGALRAFLCPGLLVARIVCFLYISLYTFSVYIYCSVLALILELVRTLPPT
ncbi:hypothetical protein K466DRAFT_499651 [Polyporus arcularius HHB13444]|uniref:DUF4218 domain-containing protein n=1 Tax=Polyporus arcularius HHB13444 TaxID=1314778 RepID=A0A5C3PAD1_9APHY|nr:hypothetical protein K466DRAFT_499651 [Polyporus arcularius HHB13444]